MKRRRDERLRIVALGLVEDLGGRALLDGDAVEVDGLRLKVAKMDGRRVARVRVTVLDSRDEDDSAANGVDES